METDDAKARGLRLRDYLAEPMARKRLRSYAALARAAGVRPNTLVDWWSVGKVPSEAALLQIATALDVPLSDLLDAYQGRVVRASDSGRGSDSGNVTVTPGLDAALLAELEERMRRAFREELEAALERIAAEQRGEGQ